MTRVHHGTARVLLRAHFTRLTKFTYHIFVGVLLYLGSERVNLPQIVAKRGRTLVEPVRDE